MEKRAILLILFLIVSVVPIIANIVIFSMIVCKRQPDRVCFYIIGNLSLTNIISSVVCEVPGTKILFFFLQENFTGIKSIKNIKQANKKQKR